MHLLNGGPDGGVVTVGGDGTLSSRVSAGGGGEIRGGAGGRFDIAIKIFAVLGLAQLHAGGSEPEVAQFTQINMGLAAFAGDEAAGTLGFAGGSAILGCRIGVDINGGIVGSARGEKGGIFIIAGEFGKIRQHHGGERVVGVVFGSEIRVLMSVIFGLLRTAIERPMLLTM